MIKLDHISKTYGTRLVLKDVNLHFEPEKTTVLLGPSGCGKSTLLKLMIGLAYPDKGGEIQFKNELLTADNIQQHRQNMGYVLQDGGLFPHLTARKNVTLMARHLKWPGEKIESRVADLAALTRLEDDDLLNRFPSQLSGGQRQRASLMRALFLDPDLLLLDEPLGALDPLLRTDLQNDLALIFRSLRKTVVIVTHDISEALFFGDNIVVLNEGEIVFNGGRNEIATTPNPFIKKFVSAQRQSFEGVF